jgi:zinc transporter ZupT
VLLAAIACAAFLSTFGGGLFAFRLQDKLHLILGFSAGAVIGVAFFDLLPEALEFGHAATGSTAIVAWAALGFISYLILDRILLFHGSLQDPGPVHTAHGHAAHDHAAHEHTSHGHADLAGQEHAGQHRAAHDHAADNRSGHDRSAAAGEPASRGMFGAAVLCVHSFLDGVAIGLAFQSSRTVGVVVAIAVLTHDFSDGINTMSIVLRNRRDRRRAFRWLLLDALAPALGVFSTLLFALPSSAFGIVLALFAGFFLYIGASDLIPESYHAHPKFLTTATTVAGAAVIFLAMRLVG